ncbi:MAG: hypothetical protein HRT35_00720 [Algicola sp.]|nr:hypothetical protein [Algicola sp.]
MHYVRRSEQPSLLTEHQHEWTTPWLAYFEWQQSSDIERPKKPTTAHWLKEQIRRPLIRDFQNNCGYCGEVLPTPMSFESKLNCDVVSWLSKGDVDHFWPKATYPERVYQWFNYIWCCKPCNQHKREFSSKVASLLNPCVAEDCKGVFFDSSTGRYCLTAKLVNDLNWQQRLDNSQLYTMLNADEICHRRSHEIMTLQDRFISLDESIKTINLLGGGLLTGAADVIEKQQRSQKKDIAAIGRVLKYPAYKRLITAQYQLLLQQFPAVKSVLAG